ncbi:uncharacterized protein LOC111406705 [Olea europaea var. sylvestris]|uniref:uncharacterized protein LOC111406705 n=1 Tax=Olea europaea var. sylvestris TaxID=158386 RepID=UPI000C1D5BD9|nr:uncharacterized protein LOC111406705 [Olea europaea var. sylvestris]
MSAIIWNARGVASVATRRRLKKLIQLHQAYLVVILELFVLQQNFAYTRRYLRFDRGAQNESNRIWFFWKSRTNVTVIVDHPQFLHVRVEDFRLARPIYLTPVYASCDATIRRDLWAGLHHISLDMDDPWLVGGDFNVITHDGERTGHNTRDRGTTAFSDMMLDYGLEVRVSLETDKLGPMWVSDDDLGPRPFRFLNVWTKHNDLLAFVSQKWSLPTHLTGMTALWEKFFRLKQGLRWWNRHVFGDIFQRVRDAEVGIDEVEIIYDRDPTPEHRNLLHHAQGRRIKSRIWSIKTQAGEVLSTPTDIQTSVIAFYQDLLSAPPRPLDHIHSNVIPRLLTVDDNLALNRPP